MGQHEAVGQMLGYLYQVRFALYLLLKYENEDSQISIEKFDDVAFIEEGKPLELLQLKHHISKSGDLSDTSNDFWRTINVWMDKIEDRDILENTKFIILTTAKAPEESASSFLKDDNNRNIEKVFNILQNVAKTSKNIKHENYYTKFVNMNEIDKKKLLKNIYIIDNSPNIVQVEEKIRNFIKFGCLPQYEKSILERLEGWWYKESIKFLISNDSVFITQNQIRNKIASFRDEYTTDNLPIDDFNFSESENKIFINSNKIFLEQLNLIELSNPRIMKAVEDYRKAFAQRSKWLKEKLIYVNDLGEYEKRLIDEWERSYYEILEEINEMTLDSEKVKTGRELYKKVQDWNINIKKKVEAPFIMRGSYHILADKKNVGWHVDFLNRLENLLVFEGAEDE